MFDWIEICLALATTALLACAFMPQLRAYRPLFLGGSALTGRSQWSKCRIYFMQSWFNLSDPQAEDVYDIESTRRFTDIELLGHVSPDESTILRFRHLLERHQFTERTFAQIRCLCRASLAL